MIYDRSTKRLFSEKEALPGSGEGLSWTEEALSTLGA
jgi:hypothetical protein